ncbi:hypothetical protein AB0M45_21730 [Nocardia sp. NPDC051787]|uniref:hypothetical protein n=1 Tax=Nocardia sp. NPDC051787 TaxID=3155415 RepID=UPI0034482B5B
MAGGEDEQSAGTGEEATDPVYVSPEDLGLTGTEDGGTDPATTAVSWDGLQDAVSSGKLKLDNGVAYKTAALYRDIYYDVTAVKSYGEKNAFVDLALSPLPEGAPLSEKLSARTVEFLGIVDQVLERLQSGFETLVDAGKAFDRADADSQKLFDGLGLSEYSEYSTPPSMPTGGALAGDSYDSLPQNPHFSDNAYIPEPSVDYGKGVAAYPKILGASITFESPFLYDLDNHAEGMELWYKMASLGEYLKTYNISDYLFNLARTWQQLGTVLSETFSDFRSRATTLTNEDWEGDSKDVWMATLMKDVNDVQNIQPATEAMRDLGTYMAYWMRATGEAMPTLNELSEVTVASEADWEQVKEFVREDRDAMVANYTSKMEIADSSFPDLAELIALMNDVGAERYTGLELKAYDDLLDSLGLDPDDILGGGSDSSAFTPAALASPASDYSSTTPGYPSYTDDLAAQQKEWARAQREAAQQQALQSALQQGIGAAQQALDQGMRLAQRAAESAAQSMAPSTLPSVPSSLDSAETSAFEPSALGGAGSAGVGSGTGAGTPKGTYDASRLFPRAGLAPGATASLTAGTPMAGMPMAGVPGAPGAAGAPGAGARPGQDSKHERAKYLDRADNIDEALGDAPDMTRPVVGDGSIRPGSGQSSAGAVATPAQERSSAPAAPATGRRQVPPSQRTVSLSDQ